MGRDPDDCGWRTGGQPSWSNAADPFDADANSKSRSQANSDPNSNADANPNANSKSKADADANTDANSQSKANANSDTDAETTRSNPNAFAVSSRVHRSHLRPVTSGAVRTSRTDLSAGGLSCRIARAIRGRPRARRDLARASKSPSD